MVLSKDVETAFDKIVDSKLELEGMLNTLGL